jgi:hypothetical protein
MRDGPENTIPVRYNRFMVKRVIGYSRVVQLT